MTTIRTCFGSVPEKALFVRYPHDLTLRLRRLGLGLVKRDVLLDLASAYNPATSEADIVWRDSRLIAERTGINHDDVRHTLRALVSDGFLSVAEPGRYGRATRYHLQPFWDALEHVLDGAEIDHARLFPMKADDVPLPSGATGVEEWFQTDFGMFPGPVGDFKPENRAKALQAYTANVLTPEDREGFREVLEMRLDHYEREDKPAAEKRKFLGTFRNICERWRDTYEHRRDVADKRPKTPAPVVTPPSRPPVAAAALPPVPKSTPAPEPVKVEARADVLRRKIDDHRADVDRGDDIALCLLRDMESELAKLEPAPTAKPEPFRMTLEVYRDQKDFRARLDPNTSGADDYLTDEWRAVLDGRMSDAELVRTKYPEVTEAELAKWFPAADELERKAA